jgi:septal ring factor EnvC (AmiA/AmiB activator)
LEAISAQLRELLVEITNLEDLRKILLLRRDDLDKIPVALLNSWLLSFPSYRFYKNHGYLALRKVEGKEDRLAAVLEELAEVRKELAETRKEVEEARKEMEERETALREARKEAAETRTKLTEFRDILNLHSKSISEIQAFLRGNEGPNSQ